MLSHINKEGAPVAAAMTDVVLLAGSRSDCLIEGVVKWKCSPEIMKQSSELDFESGRCVLDSMGDVSQKAEVVMIH